MSLNDMLCRTAKPQAKAYKILDRDGLHLQINPNGSKYWRYRFRLHGTQRTLALGTYPTVSLIEARERRFDAAKEVETGKDPILLRAERKQLEKFHAAQTFGEISVEWHGRNKYKWSPKHASIVLYRLNKYLNKRLGRTPINAVTPQLLLSCLQPIEATSPIIARRLLQYCRKIFQYAQITGRSNAPDFTDGLKQVLRTPKKGHFPALELDELPQFLEKLFTGRHPSIMTNYALKLMLYTFPRTNEMLGAKRSEVNFETAIWTIPAERMKMKLPHLIPLSTQAIAVLKALFALTRNSEFIFPSINNPRKTVSNTLLLMALRRMDYKGRMCGHGFRTIAMGVGLERLLYPFDVIDRQLSHVPESEIRRAYDRAKLLPERKKFMQALADEYDNILTSHLQKKETDGQPQLSVSLTHRAAKDNNGRINTSTKIIPINIIQANKNGEISQAI